MYQGDILDALAPLTAHPGLARYAEFSRNEDHNMIANWLAENFTAFPVSHFDTRQ